MHARAAYIRSFGTTGILLVASLLMLAMVGAVVGFHRWPGGSQVQNVPSVPLKPAPTAHLRVLRSATAPGIHKSSAARAARISRARTSTAGLVKVPVSAPHAVGYPVAISPGHVGPSAGAPQASGGGGSSDPTPRPPAPPSPPSTPQPIQQIVDEIIQSVPPPPDIPQRGQPLQIQLPGVPAIQTPPLP